MWVPEDRYSLWEGWWAPFAFPENRYSRRTVYGLAVYFLHWACLMRLAVCPWTLAWMACQMCVVAWVLLSVGCCAANVLTMAMASRPGLQKSSMTKGTTLCSGYLCSFFSLTVMLRAH